MNFNLLRMKKISLLIAAFYLVTSSMFAQDDLLKQVEDHGKKKDYADYAFKSSRVIMSHSMELLKPGTMDFRILHRFGNINDGASEFFGLDHATMRMGFDFGITKNLMVGIGRSTNKKEFDGFIKYRFIRQATGPHSVPFSLLAVVGSTLQTLKWNDPSKDYVFPDRLGYYYQIIIGRKFSDKISLQLSPTLLHRNLAPTVNDPNDLYAIGAGGRLKLTKRISLNLDYYYRLNPNTADETHNPFSVGFDFETGGHVFQLHFTNAVGMNERIFLTETTNDWAKGEIQFGFNLSRIFQIKKKKLPE
jgi:hypothetical protein